MYCFSCMLLRLPVLIILYWLKKNIFRFSRKNMKIFDPNWWTLFQKIMSFPNRWRKLWVLGLAVKILFRLSFGRKVIWLRIFKGSLHLKMRYSTAWCCKTNICICCSICSLFLYVLNKMIKKRWVSTSFCVFNHCRVNNC